MVEEHCGIAIIEMALWGAYVVAHNSGGGKDDILTPPTREEMEAAAEEEGTKPTSFSDGDKDQLWSLANTSDEYAEAIATGLALDQTDELVKFRAFLMHCRFQDHLEYG